MLYNIASSIYRSFNRIYPSKTARKYRFRNTFQRYSDTTVPHFTFFHQHPILKKSLTHSNTALSVPSTCVHAPGPQPCPPVISSYAPRHQHSCSARRSRLPVPLPFLLALDPDSYCITRSEAGCFCVAIFHLSIPEFPGFPAAQILNKILDITLPATSLITPQYVII